MMTKQRINDEIAEAMLCKSVDHLTITDLKRANST
jgi:hypothetical protein